MSAAVIEAAARKKVACPMCQEPMDYKGDGQYICPRGCGEFLVNDATVRMTETTRYAETRRNKLDRSFGGHVQTPWPELVEGLPERLRRGMIDVATLPLQSYEIGPCRGHGGHGGGGGGGRIKSPQRQKLDAWKRKSAPGKIIRSVRVG